MNRAQACNYEPDGIGLRWMAEILSTPMLHGKTIVENVQANRFREALTKALPLPPEHLSISELYERIPAPLRSPESYKTMSKILTRWNDMGRVLRIGSCGHYKYASKEGMPKL